MMMIEVVVNDMKMVKGQNGLPLEPVAAAWHGFAINDSEGLQEDDCKGYQDSIDERKVLTVCCIGHWAWLKRPDTLAD